MTAPRAAIYVLDTGPLITLAAADSLDFLLYPNAPVIIPDAVFYEATRDSAKLGAQSIMDWVKAHHAQSRSPSLMRMPISMRHAWLTRELMNRTWGNARPSRSSRNRRGSKAMRGRFCYAKKRR